MPTGGVYRSRFAAGVDAVGTGGIATAAGAAAGAGNAS